MVRSTIVVMTEDGMDGVDQMDPPSPKVVAALHRGDIGGEFVRAPRQRDQLSRPRSVRSVTIRKQAVVTHCGFDRVCLRQRPPIRTTRNVSETGVCVT